MSSYDYFDSQLLNIDTSHTPPVSIYGNPDHHANTDVTVGKEAFLSHEPQVNSTIKQDDTESFTPADFEDVLKSPGTKFSAPDSLEEEGDENRRLNAKEDEIKEEIIPEKELGSQEETDNEHASREDQDKDKGDPFSVPTATHESVDFISDYEGMPPHQDQPIERQLSLLKAELADTSPAPFRVHNFLLVSYFSRINRLKAQVLVRFLDPDRLFLVHFQVQNPTRE